MPSENEKRRGEASRETRQFRDFKGMNYVDSRTAIDDTEFVWLENAMTIGKGKVRVLPHQGASVFSISAGIAAAFGVTFKNAPLFIVIGADGSLWQVTPGGMATTMAGPGTVTALADVAVWQGVRILIVDPTTGYFSWDGTTFTTLDATKVGTSLAVFAGRVWIANARTVQVTDAGSYSVFVGGSAFSFVITDEAFPGNITRLISSLEQLWMIGSGAINVISNVQVISGIASYSNTNVLNGIGTVNTKSVIAFYRALALLSKAGIYGVTGVTPQKLSDKLDDLFQKLTITPDTPAALVTLNELPVLCMLVTYNDPLVPARPLLLCYSQGRWFTASQGSLTNVTSVLVNGAWQAWGTDGTGLYQLFGDASVPVNYTMKSKLYDFGSMVTVKQIYRMMLEFASTNVVAPTLTIETENGPQVVTLAMTNEVYWTNALLQQVPWITS